MYNNIITKIMFLARKPNSIIFVLILAVMGLIVNYFEPFTIFIVLLPILLLMTGSILFVLYYINKKIDEYHENYKQVIGENNVFYEKLYKKSTLYLLKIILIAFIFIILYFVTLYKLNIIIINITGLYIFLLEVSHHCSHFYVMGYI